MGISVAEQTVRSPPPLPSLRHLRLVGTVAILSMRLVDLRCLERLSLSGMGLRAMQYLSQPGVHPDLQFFELETTGHGSVREESAIASFLKSHRDLREVALTQIIVRSIVAPAFGRSEETNEFFLPKLERLWAHVVAHNRSPWVVPDIYKFLQQRKDARNSTPFVLHMMDETVLASVTGPNGFVDRVQGIISRNNEREAYRSRNFWTRMWAV